MWRSEQRPELFEIGQGLTSEEVNGSAFEVMDIIASIVSLALGLGLDGWCIDTLLPPDLFVTWGFFSRSP